MGYVTGMAGVVLVLMQVACASHPERFVLLPQEGRTTALDVTGPDGRTVTLASPYAGATVARGQTQAEQLDAETVAQRYRAVMVAIPMLAKKFSLYFITGGTELTKESEVQLPVILAEVAHVPAAEIIVIGHTDRVGKQETNDALSLRRAQMVRARLIAVGVPDSAAVAIGRGDREPEVMTADQVASPRNRRVDVKVR